jgi:hypothetical protein
MKPLACVSFLCFLSLCCPAYAQQEEKRASRFNDFVTELPAVDKVEILLVTIPKVGWQNLDCTKPDVICRLPTRFRGRMTASKILLSDGANKISNLWRNLKPGNGMGCFAPVYLLRFFNRSELILTTEVCFHCCNIAPTGYGITSMCGDEKAVAKLKEFLSTTLPYPKPVKRK